VISQISQRLLELRNLILSCTLCEIKICKHGETKSFTLVKLGELCATIWFFILRLFIIPFLYFPVVLELAELFFTTVHMDLAFIITIYPSFVKPLQDIYLKSFKGLFSNNSINMSQNGREVSTMNPELLTLWYLSDRQMPLSLRGFRFLVFLLPFHLSEPEEQD
jgi:hypothetical protein